MVWEIDPPPKKKKKTGKRPQDQPPPPPPPSPDDQWITAPMPVSVYMALNVFGSDFFFFLKKIIQIYLHIIGACSYIPWSSGESILLKWQANNKNKKGSHADSKNLHTKCKNKDGYSAEIIFS